MAETFGIATFESMAKAYRGQARARLGDRDGLDEQLEGLREMFAQGMHIGQIGWWAERAELFLEQGDVAAARDAIDYAGSDEVFLEQRFYVPKMLRVRSMVAEAEGADAAEVGRDRDEAIAVAKACGMVNLLTGLRAEASWRSVASAYGRSKR